MNNNKPLSRAQERIKEMQKREEDYQDEVYYIFLNHRNCVFTLPKKSICGKKDIPPGGTFKGDESFMAFAKTGDIRPIETIHPPFKKVNESAGDTMEKLILDQPESFTREGKTENVVRETPVKVISDSNANKENDILLTENPMDGIEILKD